MTAIPLDKGMFEAPLPPEQQALAERFVEEYMRDFDPYQACLRLGFHPSFAATHAKTLFEQPWVQCEIANRTRSLNIEDVREVAADKALIINTFREASQKGPFATRVSAATKLAEIRGIAKPDGTGAAEQAIVDLLKNFAVKAPV